MAEREPMECPQCHKANIVYGHMNGTAAVTKTSRPWGRGLGSSLTIACCRDCGLVLTIWVDDPNRLV